MVTMFLFDPTANLLTAVGNFRSNGIGTNNLKYGAAYGPTSRQCLIWLLMKPNRCDSEYQWNCGCRCQTEHPASGNNRLYELAKAAIRDMACKMPPQPAMAGIYAAVDNSRGVWKAPANVSINGVIQPTIQFSNRDRIR